MPRGPVARAVKEPEAIHRDQARILAHAPQRQANTIDKFDVLFDMTTVLSLLVASLQVQKYKYSHLQYGLVGMVRCFRAVCVNI